MKKTKRLLALVLAMMMAFSLLAMPAMAAGDDEGIMPLIEHSHCPKCGAAGAHGTKVDTEDTRIQADSPCGTEGTPKVHSHCIRYDIEEWECPDCGLFTQRGTSYRYCLTYNRRI